MTADESFTLPPGSFAGYRIEPGHRARLSYEFRAARGRPIDVFLFDERRFLSYRSGGDVSLTSGVRLGRNAGEGERTLERDTEYVLVFDHTDAGVADTADSPVTVDTDVALAVY